MIDKNVKNQENCKIIKLFWVIFFKVLVTVIPKFTQFTTT